jgi:hypothetical protein
MVPCAFPSYASCPFYDALEKIGCDHDAHHDACCVRHVRGVHVHHVRYVAMEIVHIHPSLAHTAVLRIRIVHSFLTVVVVVEEEDGLRPYAEDDAGCVEYVVDVEE